MKFKDVKLKNEEGNDRKAPEQRVFVVENTAEATDVPVVVQPETESYTLERIDLLIANTQKDLNQIQARLEWALKVKDGIQKSLAKDEKKKDN